MGKAQARIVIMLCLIGLGAAATGVSSAPVAAQSDQVAAPTDLSFAGNTLRWTDDSDNVEGFRIVAEAFDGSRVRREYVVGSNAREFPVPAEVLPSCPDRPSARYQVVAFRGAIDSEVAEVGVIGECAPIAPVAALPTTGAGDDASLVRWAYTGLAIVVASAGAFVLNRVLRGPRSL